MKKLLCFMGELNVDFQAESAQYYSDKLAERGCEITFMVNFDTTVSDFMYGEIEKKIISIPYINEYDGIIIYPDTFAIPGMYEELSEYLDKNAKCPVVSMRVRDERFYSVILGDYLAICDMVEHFIVKHRKKRICFMTGRMDLEDAHTRLKAYEDTMKKHGLEVTEGMVFYGDYWREKGDEAVEWFISRNEELPEAVICSNDYMAISVCNSLVKRGIRVPEDIAVSGLDDIKESIYHFPSITSVGASPANMCEKTLEVFFNVWEGREQEKLITIPLEAKYRTSCGCICETDFSVFYEEKELYYSEMNFIPYLCLDLGNADDFDEMITSFYFELLRKPYGISYAFGTIYFCMCDESEREDCRVENELRYTDNMFLKAIVSVNGVERCDYKFKRREILPRKYRKLDTSLFVFTLHCKDYCYGYIVVQDENIMRSKDFMKPFVFSLGNSLDKIRMYSENKDIRILREQSYIDELTQIPNRRSMERYIRKLFEKLQHSDHEFCIMSIDLDGLKYINDTFGHIEGDIAIKAAAKILDESKPDSGIAARIGGDEFVVIFISDNEDDAVDYIEKVNRNVELNNREWDKPYKLSMSLGYEYCRKDTDVLLSMHKADNKMYEIKKSKKKNR